MALVACAPWGLPAGCRRRSPHQRGLPATACLETQPCSRTAAAWPPEPTRALPGTPSVNPTWGLEQTSSTQAGLLRVRCAPRLFHGSPRAHRLCPEAVQVSVRGREGGRGARQAPAGWSPQARGHRAACAVSSGPAAGPGMTRGTFTSAMSLSWDPGSAACRGLGLRRQWPLAQTGTRLVFCFLRFCVCLLGTREPRLPCGPEPALRPAPHPALSHRASRVPCPQSPSQVPHLPPRFKAASPKLCALPGLHQGPQGCEQSPSPTAEPGPSAPTGQSLSLSTSVPLHLCWALLKGAFMPLGINNPSPYASFLWMPFF